MQYVNKRKLQEPGEPSLIAEYTDKGSLVAYYKGYYKHRLKRYVLYPHEKITTLADNFTKKTISAFDVRYA
ncbi:MAG: hypothetical protein ACYCWE_21055 [Eubacteriales bacterium]